MMLHYKNRMTEFSFPINSIYEILSHELLYHAI